MAKNFKELQANMSPERRAPNEAAAAKMIDEMALDELREARDLTQEQLDVLNSCSENDVKEPRNAADQHRRCVPKQNTGIRKVRFEPYWSFPSHSLTHSHVHLLSRNFIVGRVNMRVDLP